MFHFSTSAEFDALLLDKKKERISCFKIWFLRLFVQLNSYEYNKWAGLHLFKALCIAWNAASSHGFKFLLSYSKQQQHRHPDISYSPPFLRPIDSLWKIVFWKDVVKFILFDEYQTIRNLYQKTSIHNTFCFADQNSFILLKIVWNN